MSDGSVDIELAADELSDAELDRPLATRICLSVCCCPGHCELDRVDEDRAADSAHAAR